MTKTEHGVGAQALGEMRGEEVRVMDAATARATFFKNKKSVRREGFTYNGVEMEFVQPSVGDMVNKDDSETERAFFIRAMIKHSVLPGTDERVFDDTDYDALLELPADGDFQKFTKIVTDVMNLNVTDAVKN